MMVKSSNYLQVRYLRDIVYKHQVFWDEDLSCQIQTYLKSCYHKIESWLVYLQESLWGHPDLTQNDLLLNKTSVKALMLL